MTDLLSANVAVLVGLVAVGGLIALVLEMTARSEKG